MSSNRKVKSPQGIAAGRDITISAETPTLTIQAIHGGTNFIGNQGTVNVQIGTGRRSRSSPRPLPGPEHIDGDQRRTLHDLCNEWVELHGAIKKTALSYGSAWSRINAAVGSTTYREIPREQFEVACAFIRKEMAILRGMRSAPAKDLAWRSKRIAAIKARCKNQIGDPEAYKAYIARNFKVTSLADLATDELQKTYAYIMAKKAVK